MTKCLKINTSTDIVKKYFLGGLSYPEVAYQYRKSDPEMYKILFQKYNLKISETLFIDNNQANLKVAKELDFKTILFDSNMNLDQEIAFLTSR